MEKPAPARSGTDDLATLASIGIVAYVGETMLHELGGHGGMCLATGGTITALAPLWMHCSVITRIMVASGPLANFAGALLFWLILRVRPPASAAMRLFLWLSLGFNSLVASAYLCVGAVTQFGDWAELAIAAHPVWLARVVEFIAGISGFYIFRRVLADLYAHLFGGAALLPARLRRRTLFPAAIAALVACAAEIHGGNTTPAGMALPLACTLGIGFALLSIDETPEAKRAERGGFAPIGCNFPWIFAGLAIAAVFVLVIGTAPSLARHR